MKVITPVGMSIFDNCLTENKRQLKDQLRDLKKEPFENWHGGFNENKIENIKKDVLDNLNNKNYKGSYPSAEIKSLLKIHEKHRPKNLTAYLIATDSLASVLAAEVIKEYFEEINKCGIKIEFTKEYFDKEKPAENRKSNSSDNEEKPAGSVVGGLTVDSKEKFENQGLVNLLECVLNAEKPDKFKKENVALNITGGYKALVPYLTVIGQVYSLPTYYIYEDTEDLLEVPQLPLEYDYTIVHENYFVFEDIKLNKSKKNLPDKKEFIGNYSQETYQELEKEGLVTTISYTDEKGTVLEKVAATFIGDLIFKKYEAESYGENFSNLKGTMMELKLYKYFVEDKYPGAKVTHSYETVRQDGSKNIDFEIDVLVENGDGLIAAEVKSGKNPPVLGERKTIERKLTQGAFHKLPEKFPHIKDIKYEVYLYSNRNIEPKFMRNIQDLHKKYPEKTKNLKWYHIIIKPDENFDKYKISEAKIKLIYPKEGE